MKNIKDFDKNAKRAKADFEENSLPRLLKKFSTLDEKKLSLLAIDFFDIYCDLNQVNKAAESHGQYFDGKFKKEELIEDTKEQWQYYAAFFYHRLTADSELNCSYTPKELEHMELKMSCPQEETFGLGHDEAVSIIGSLVRESIDSIKSNFKDSWIYTLNPIPNLNRDNPEKLQINLPFLS